jgi:sialate O-acetylesterase
VPAVTYNRMINPLLQFRIKGVIWYQGESNANNMRQATAYEGQLGTLIHSWRNAWVTHGLDRPIPFFWVQLPNFGARDAEPPTESPWAKIRESMTSDLHLEKTGQAITIDVGESGDIHPKDKETVGHRLALVARRVAYGENVESSGPTMRSYRATPDGKMTVEFDHIGPGLTSRSTDGAVDGFAIAGSDKHWVWAKARIEGNRVVVWNDAVRTPMYLRYLWMNDPEGALLFSKDGLPAAPFRTDRY